MNDNREKFVSASADFGTFVRNYNGFSLDVVPYKKSGCRGFRAGVDGMGTDSSFRVHGCRDGTGAGGSFPGVAEDGEYRGERE